MIRDSAIGIDTGLWAGRSDVRLLAGEREVSSSKQVHTDPGTHPASYSMGNKGISPRGKAAAT